MQRGSRQTPRNKIMFSVYITSISVLKGKITVRTDIAICVSCCHGNNLFTSLNSLRLGIFQLQFENSFLSFF